MSSRLTRRCSRHDLALAPDGLCVLCRRAARASVAPVEAVGGQEDAPRWLGVCMVVAACGVMAWPVADSWLRAVPAATASLAGIAPKPKSAVGQKRARHVETASAHETSASAATDTSGLAAPQQALERTEQARVPLERASEEHERNAASAQRDNDTRSEQNAASPLRDSDDENENEQNAANPLRDNNERNAASPLSDNDDENENEQNAASAHRENENGQNAASARREDERNAALERRREQELRVARRHERARRARHAQALSSARRSVDITMYSTRWCAACQRARAYMQAENIAFTELDVEADKSARARQRALNPRGSVPTIEIDDQVLIGFSVAAFEKRIERAARQHRSGR